MAEPRKHRAEDVDDARFLDEAATKLSMACDILSGISEYWLKQVGLDRIETIRPLALAAGYARRKAGEFYEQAIPSPTQPPTDTEG